MTKSYIHAVEEHIFFLHVIIHQKQKLFSHFTTQGTRRTYYATHHDMH